MKKFPALWAALLAVFAVLPALLGFTITSAVAVSCVSIIFPVMTGKLWYFPITACLSFAAHYCIFGFDIMFSSVFCAFCLPVALIITICLMKKTNFTVLLTSSALFETLLGFGGIYYITKKTGQTAVEFLASDMIEYAKTLGGDGVSQIENVIIPAIDLILPSFLIITATVFAYGIFAVSRVVLGRNGVHFPHLPGLDEFHMNKSQAVIFLILLIASLLFGIISPVIYNVLTIVMFLLTACGFSVVSFFLKHLGISTGMRFFVYILIFTLLAPMASTLLLIIGIRDSFKPFRQKFYTP